MNTKVPLFALNYDGAEEEAVLETLRSGWISTGPKTAELENKFAGMIDVNHALAVTNCTSALHLSLLLSGIKPGDEVICPSLTFVATVNAILYVGATPVFADISSYDDLTIDPEDIENKISHKTKAIIIVHYGGFSCQMDRIEGLVRKYNLKLIEDACHGPLSTYNGKKLGSFGNFGCFSFFSNKNISIGEGGMLVTNDSDLYDMARILRSHGMTSMSYDRDKGHATRYDVLQLGYNYRMDDIRASIGLEQLKKLKEDLDQRRKNRNYYLEVLGDIQEIIIPFRNHPFFSSNYIFTIILRNSTAEKRDRIRSFLAEKGIQTSVHYPAVHAFSIYSEYSLPLLKTEYVSDNLITLPMFSGLSQSNIDYIRTNLEKALSS